MIRAHVVGGLLILFFLGLGVVHAATDQFLVRTLIGDDVIPPSVPANLTATPVAMSQINLSWSSSTDDYQLSGYFVYRDDIQIATTTNPSYADVGLSASTTYTYYVTAFDYFNNISGSSTLVATSTYATPTPPVVTPSSTDGPIYGSISRLGELVSLQILPSQNGAIIRYETRGFVKSIVQWGTTISYEGGTSAERSFAKYHEIHIDDLRPGTRYRLSIRGETQGGVQGILTETSFSTLPTDDVFPPGNVTNLRAVHLEGDVILTWENPVDADFKMVRVLRNDIFYPSDNVDGWVVYEGEGRMVIDKEALRTMDRVYYTVFTYDEKGNVSSGAVVAVGKGITISPPLSTGNEINLDFNVINLYQNDEELVPEREGVYQINGGQYLTIAIPYEALPEHLKTILVTLREVNNSDQTFSFLLRINKEKTAYTARLAPFEVDGKFIMRISVFDYTTAQIGYTEGELHSEISMYIRDDMDASASFFLRIVKFFSENYVLIFVSLLLALLIFSSRLLRRRE